MLECLLNACNKESLSLRTYTELNCMAVKATNLQKEKAKKKNL